MATVTKRQTKPLSRIKTDPKPNGAPEREHLALDERRAPPAESTVGKCADCGEPIERGRLDLKPTETLCARCDSESQVGGMAPPPNVIERIAIELPPETRATAWLEVAPVGRDRWAWGYYLSVGEGVINSEAIEPCRVLDDADCRETAKARAARALAMRASSQWYPQSLVEPLRAFALAAESQNAKCKTQKSKVNGHAPVSAPGPDVRAPAAAPASREAPPRSDDGRLRLALSELARNRFNPRAKFDVTELEELAESLAKNGQLQAVVVRPVPEGARLPSIADPSRPAAYEIVAGERRALAAQRAGWQKVACEVIECDDARACELAIAENRDRRDISQVEYARGLQKLADLKGLDPAKLAADQRLSEQHVRNLLRLLEAPPAWQQRVIEGVLTGTHLRHALPFLHVEAIEKDLLKHIEENQLDGRFAESEKKWRRKIEDVVRERGARLSRSVSLRAPEHKWGEVRIDPKDPRYRELDVIELPSRWGGAKEKFALNRKAANAILAEKANAWKARNGGAKGKGDAGKAPSKADMRKQREAEKRERRNKLLGIVRFWRSWLISSALARSDDQELLLRVCLAANYGAHAAMPFHQSAGDWALEQLGADWQHGMSQVTWPHTFFGLAALELFDWIKGVAVRSFWPGEAPEDAEEAEEFGPRWWPEKFDDHQAQWLTGLQIDPTEQWRAKDDDGKQQFLGPLTEAWLDLHDRDQLAELAAEWKVPVLEKDSEAEIRRKLLGNAARLMPMPAELAGLLKRTTKSTKIAKRKTK